MYMPVRQLKNVVLPAPLGPMRPTISPSCTLHAHVVDGREAAEAHGDALGLEDDLADRSGRSVGGDVAVMPSLPLPEVIS